MNKYFFIIIFFFPLFLFGQTDIDTIPSDQVFIKKIHGEHVYFKVNDSINPINNVIIKEYDAKCNGRIKELKEIRDGKLKGSKRITYYFESCSIKEVFFTNEKKHKTGTYVKYNERGFKQMEGKFNAFGNEDGVFSFYDSLNCNTYYFAYNDGHRLFRFNRKDSLEYLPAIKNIISVDLCTWAMGNYKVVYERYLNKEKLLKFEFNCKPHSPNQGTLVFNLDNKNQYIYFVPQRYLFSIEQQHFFGYNKYKFYKYRHPFYVSYGVQFLYKTYDHVLYHYVYGDYSYGRNYDYLKSINSYNYGIRLLAGKKSIIGRSDSKVKEMIDFFVGIGFYYSLTKTTTFGKGLVSSLYSSPHLTYYNPPFVTNINRVIPTFLAGLRLGIGW